MNRLRLFIFLFLASWNGVLQCMSAVLTMTGSIVAAKVNDWERISHL